MAASSAAQGLTSFTLWGGGDRTHDLELKSLAATGFILPLFARSTDSNPSHGTSLRLILDAQFLPEQGVFVPALEVFHEVVPKNLEEGFSDNKGQRIIQNC